MKPFTAQSPTEATFFKRGRKLARLAEKSGLSPLFCGREGVRAGLTGKN
jgi:hypothetical protein